MKFCPVHLTRNILELLVDVPFNPFNTGFFFSIFFWGGQGGEGVCVVGGGFGSVGNIVEKKDE